MSIPSENGWGSDIGLGSWRRLFASRVFWILVLFFGLIFFIWPVITASDRLLHGFVRRRHLFARPAFWWLVFIVAAILFCWPFITPAPQWSGLNTYSFLMISWAVVIGLIMIIGTSFPHNKDGDEK